MAILGNYAAAIFLDVGDSIHSLRVVVGASHAGAGPGGASNFQGDREYTYDWNLATPGVGEDHVLKITDGTVELDPTQDAIWSNDAAQAYVTLTPYDAADGGQGSGKAGTPVTLTFPLPQDTSQQRAGLSAGGVAVAPKIVAGTNVTIALDGNNDIEISASGGGGGVDALEDVGDVAAYASLATDEVIQWSGTAWVHQTLAEAGISAVGHTHDAADIDSGTFANARISQGNVTQHEAALSLLGIEGLADPGVDRILFWDNGAGGFAFLAPGTAISIAGTSLNVDPGLTGSGAGLEDDGTTVSVEYDAGASNVVTAAPNTPITPAGVDAILVADGGLTGAVEKVQLSTLPRSILSGAYVASVGLATDSGLSDAGTATDPILALDIENLHDWVGADGLQGVDKVALLDVAGDLGNKAIQLNQLDLSLFDNSTAGFVSNALTGSGAGLEDNGATVSVEYDAGGSNVVTAAPNTAITPAGVDAILLADGGLTGNVESVQLQDIPLSVLSKGNFLESGDSPTLTGTWTFTGTFVDQRTNIGETAQTYTALAATDWDQPVGTSIFVNAGTSTGEPSGAAKGYWLTVGRRDVNDGYAGLYVEDAGRMWTGVRDDNSTDGSPTWTRVGTVTSVATGTGLSGGPITGSGTINLSIGSLTLDAGDMVAGDSFAVHIDGVGTRRIAPGDVPLSILFNDAGFSSNALEVAGAGLEESPAGTVKVDYGAGGLIADAPADTGLTVLSTDGILIGDGGVDSAVVAVQISQLPFTNNSGDITRVNITAGNGLSGTSVNTASGDHVQTLTVGAGDGITVNASNVAVDGTVVRTTGAQSIAGTKTFTSRVHFDGNQVHFDIVGSDSSWDFSLGNIQSITNSGARTITFANAQEGGSYILLVKDDTGAASDWTWPTVNWQDGAEPVFPQVIGDFTVVHLIYDGTDYIGYWSNHS